MAQGAAPVGALLQAMAPVAVQSMWSMRSLDPTTSVSINAEPDETSRRKAMSFNINTCHIWDEEGEFTKAVLAGEQIETPLWAVERLAKLGRKESEWGTVSGE
ncbi:MAG: hypothetical protein R2706_13705 [Acidimicrobiales bacterium]